MDCEDCRHLTVVGLHDTGPRGSALTQDQPVLAQTPYCREGTNFLVSNRTRLECEPEPLALEEDTFTAGPVVQFECEGAPGSLVGKRTVNRASLFVCLFYSSLFYSILFCSILGCVLPLHKVALRQSPPTFSVLCCPCPYRSLLFHTIMSPTTL